MQSLKLVEEEGRELDIIRDLFREYAAELNEDLCFQSFDAEVEDPLKKYVRQGGLIMLAYIDEQPAACIALMPLTPRDGEHKPCEMKRLYVRPQYRQYGLGKELVARLIEMARERGFDKMQLDTLQRLQPAIRLYERCGFTHTGAYYANPIADAVYMEKLL
jgi:ribosomal protein S18 acetylase RimI-like enzyme